MYYILAFKKDYPNAIEYPKDSNGGKATIKFEGVWFNYPGKPIESVRECQRAASCSLRAFLAIL